MDVYSWTHYKCHIDKCTCKKLKHKFGQKQIFGLGKGYFILLYFKRHTVNSYTIHISID